MPPVPPLMTSNVAVDAKGTAWVSRPWGLEAMGMEPLGSTNPGTTPPANPQLGWLWWDSGVNALKVWDGTTWLAAGGGGGGIGEPTTAGNWLRTNTGTWVQGLPLYGGTLTGQLNQTVTAGVSGYTATHVGMGGQARLDLMANNGFASVTLSSAVANNNTIYGAKGGVTAYRWGIVVGNNAAESAPQTGSNFAIQRYTNLGVLLDSPFTITRATGAVTIPVLILPTTDPGVPGAVWNNGGVVSISP